MIRSLGAYSSDMPTCPSTCPSCGASWLGEPIPEGSRKWYGDATHFRRAIAVYDRDQDRTTGWACPDCGKVEPAGRNATLPE